MRTTYSDEKKALVVYVRFGSLTSEGPPLRSMTEVRDVTGVKLTSCYSIIRDWRKKGYVISNGKKGLSRRTKVSEELEKTLVDA